MSLAVEYATHDDSTRVEVNGGYVQLNNSDYTITCEDGRTFTSHIPTEEVQEVPDLIERARRSDSASNVIINIINKEMETFCQGQKSVNEVAGII